MQETTCVPLELSAAAQALWAKSDYGEGEYWLPLFIHASDTCGIILKLWDEWLPGGTRTIISTPLGGNRDLARCLVGFVGAIHDVGKATPVFQAGAYRSGFDAEESDLSRKPRRAGLPIRPELRMRRHPTHPIAGAVILERYLEETCGWDDYSSRLSARLLSAVVGAHHGRMPSTREMKDARIFKTEMGWLSASENAWWPVQCELVEYALKISGLREDDLAQLRNHPLPVQAASVVSGLVIMADWMASNQEFFPLVSARVPVPRQYISENAVRLPEFERRVEWAWRDLDIPPAWQGDTGASRAADVFVARFGLPSDALPRPVQWAAIEAAGLTDDPGMIVIEAPMGEGKTEAALAAAEILAARSGRGGICVALPTMATTDAMFGRVHRWLERIQRQHPGQAQSLYLAHGKAGLNDEFRGLARTGGVGVSLASVASDLDVSIAEGVVVADWLTGRKKGMLANFVVCTVDQVLMGALQMKHLALRHIALANKVVIIDECHAYDVYMRSYLERVLEWLGSWRVPVVLLSATLPSDRREGMLETYRKGVAAALSSKEKVSSSEKEQKGSLLKRRKAWAASAEHNESDRTTSDPPTAQPETILSDAGKLNAYPLVTYTTSKGLASLVPEPSSRSTSVILSLIGDGIDELERLLRESLRDGGCAGVICTTVRRAQEAARALRELFPACEVRLTHSAFMDLDRMENEQALRDALGPQATRENGNRPASLIVVGTQVLEQSLDIDFDVLVTDIAPVDLLLQRMGRLHRHARCREDRPDPVAHARCFVRGIKEMESGGPDFAKGVASVYQPALLLESLSVTGLVEEGATREIELPRDIAPFVQRAYGSGVVDCIPATWVSTYESAVERRDAEYRGKNERAQACLLRSVAEIVRDECGLEDLFAREVGDVDEQRGIQAVRDTQETIEVLLARRADDGLRLPPWIGDDRNGIPHGARIPTEYEPNAALARLFSRCSVRLPLVLCAPEHLEGLIDELEKGCQVGAWQQSRWLEGQLAIPMNLTSQNELEARIFGWQLRYSRDSGLSAVRF